MRQVYIGPKKDLVLLQRRNYDLESRAPLDEGPQSTEIGRIV